MNDEHDMVKGELAAYALDALDGADRARVERHLGDCAACQRELLEHQALLGLLPHQLDLAAPPPTAKAALLAKARAGRAAPRAGLWDRLRPPAPALRWAAAGLVIAGLLGWNIHLQRQAANVETTVSVEALATLPDGRIVALLGTGRPAATARLFVTSDGRQGQLVIAGLPPLPPDRTYQLWFARPGQPTVTGGAFLVDGRGEGIATVTIPAPLDQVRAIAVTEEPAPGSPAPTGEHLLDARL
jgi:anti-sigma-K factor RskA